MSNEELNKKMEFIVEHQAKFAAEMEMMREAQAEETKLRQHQDQKLTDALLSIVDIVGRITRTQMRAEDNIEKLTQAQMHTDERLNNLINVVERHISGNGGPANPS